jgi:hypothetical protein
MTLDELRDYAMLLRGNKMRSYQNAGTAMTEEQFRRAFAANMAQQGYSNLDPAQVDILASREWPKFKAGTSQYQFLAQGTTQAPMTASQVTSMPELSFIPPAISPDEVFPNPQSSMDPTMSPYAQQAMGQVTGFYPNQPAPTQEEQISPFARMAMGQASGDFMGMASQMPAFLKSMQQTPVGTPQPGIEEEDTFEPSTGRPNRWDRKVAREQARKAREEGAGEGDQYGPQGADFFNNDSNGNDIPDYLEMAGNGQDQEASMMDQILLASAMFNPGGADLEGTLYNIGRYAGSDSPYKGLQMGLSGASAVMKGGRSLLSGFGYAKASREAKDWYDQQMRKRQYNPVEQSAYGYTGDVAVNEYGGLFKFENGSTMPQQVEQPRKPVDFATDPRFQPGEYVEFEYGGKMYKGTIKENNGKTISLK